MKPVTVSVDAPRETNVVDVAVTPCSVSASEEDSPVMVSSAPAVETEEDEAMEMVEDVAPSAVTPAPEDVIEQPTKTIVDEIILPAMSTSEPPPLVVNVVLCAVIDVPCIS